ncbi:hypothetical protein SAMN05444003_1479 [Cognatiyoonia sediminum]|uniref:Uncharacterized protein n=1 Tax=Cognatiyoonia sediminum TaxID=1508389 RepID=A0A1M5NL47_9RHOB|nr:hypothetical protein SAMN05444003_1479 [Cognatiyoonia sediminum]
MALLRVTHTTIYALALAVTAPSTALADERYAVLLVNDICLNSELSHQDRIDEVDKRGWTRSGGNGLQFAASVAAAFEELAPELSEQLNSDLRSEEWSEHLWREGNLVRSTAAIWEQPTSFLAPNGAHLILTKTSAGPHICIFLAPEPRSLIFGRFGVVGRTNYVDGNAIFRGALHDDGSLLEYREINSKTSKKLFGSNGYRFLALVLLNKTTEVPT